MYLQSLASTFPTTVIRQPECFELLRSSGALDRLKSRSRALLEKILLGDSGIETRHFANDELPGILELDGEGLHRAFESAAPKLANDALGKACERAKLAPEEIDALLVCTCTGYLCPGVSSYVAESLDLRKDVFLQDLLGLGCGAALPMLQTAKGILASSPDALVATVAVEVCSAAFFLDDDPGALVSLCLFGDGAAAALWRSENGGGQFRMANFHTMHQPLHREKIRFINSGGKLKNQLHRSVPELAANAVAELYAQRSIEPGKIISHTGGRDVIDALQSRIPNHSFSETRTVLRNYGNISSPSVLVALERALNSYPRDLWLTTFGAGFAAHACELLLDNT